MAGNCFALLGPNVERIQIYLPKVGSRPAGWFKYSSASDPGALPIFGFDGGSGGTDSLTIFRTDIESASPVGRLANEYQPGSSTVRLDFIEPFEKGTLEDGDIVALVNGNRAMVLEAGQIDSSSRAYAVLGDRFRPDMGQSLPDSTTFPRGTYVYNLRNVTLVTFQIDSEINALVADYHDHELMADNLDKDEMVIVAHNIEDFQVRYWLGGTAGGLVVRPLQGADSINESDFLNNSSWVRAVNLAMVAVSPTVDEKRGLVARQALFNHTDLGPNDRRLRRSLAETVFLRNYEQW